jgi:hypothetical protein
MFSQVFLNFFEIAKNITIKILLHMRMCTQAHMHLNVSPKEYHNSFIGLIKIKLAHQFFSSYKYC